MRLVCPNCEAKYEVPDDAIPDTGRDVQCANCGHAWFQMRARATPSAPVAAEGPAPMPEPAPTPAPLADPVAMDAGVGAVVSDAVDPPVKAESVDAMDAAILSEGPASAEGDAQGPGLDAIPDGEARPSPELVPELASEFAPAPETEPEFRPDPAEWTAASDEALAAALSTADVVPEQGLDAALSIVTDPGDALLVADGIAVDTGAAARIDGAVSDAAPLHGVPDPATDGGGSDFDSDTGADAPQDTDGPDAVTQSESPALVAAAATGAAAYAVDESVLAILREEAERESNARRADAQSLETQTDLGLAAGAKKKKSGAKVEAKPPARRDLLPDVEEINSTLRPSVPDADAEILGAAGMLSSPARRGFRGGFLVVMTLAILCATLYIIAPRLGAMVPALSDPLQAYVGFIDGARLHLDGLMRSATVAINGG